MRQSIIDFGARLLIFTCESSLWVYLGIFLVLSKFGYGSPLLQWICAGLCFIDCFQAWNREFVRQFQAAPTAPEKRKEFIASERHLMNLYQKTGYGVLRQLEPYFGKWTSLTGVYLGALESLQHDAIHLTLRLADGRQINVRFSIDQRAEIENLQQGQPITAIAQVVPVPNCGSGWFALEGASLNETRTSPTNPRSQQILAAVH